MKKTREELEKEGWVEITGFGLGIVFGKGKERILWIPKTGEIMFNYTKD